MPGNSEAELLEQGDDFVTIRTNGSAMRRHNIECSVGDDEVILRFDEVYEAEVHRKIAHFEGASTAPNSGGVQFCRAVSDVRANGVLVLLFSQIRFAQHVEGVPIVAEDVHREHAALTGALTRLSCPASCHRGERRMTASADRAFRCGSPGA